MQRKLRKITVKYKPPKLLTVPEFKQSSIDWMELCENELIQVQIPRTDNKGKLIKILKPKPPTIESYCRYVGIDYERFNAWYNDKEDFEMHKVAREIKDFIYDKLLEYGMLGLISERMVQWYMQNNSRYKGEGIDIQVNVTANKPAWLQGPTQQLPPANQKALPCESIDYVDIKEEK